MPAAPAYGDRSIAEVLSSAAASLGSRASTPAEAPRREACLRCPRRRPGRQLLKQKSAHTPFLRSVLQAGLGAVPAWVDSAFPSTTVASLASFGTGLPAGQHGMVGYDVLDPDQDRVVNMLGQLGRRRRPAAMAAAAHCLRAGRRVCRRQHRRPAAVQRLRDDQGRAAGRTLPGRDHLPRPDRGRGGGHGRRRELADVLLRPRTGQGGHRYGCQSPQWEHQLEELDATVRRLNAALPAGTTVLVTGDHGMVDVPESQRIDYSAHPELIAGVRHTAGEPRMVHLYLRTGRTTPAGGGCWMPGGHGSATGSGLSPAKRRWPPGCSAKSAGR